MTSALIDGAPCLWTQRRWPPTPAWEVKEGFSEPVYLMIDLSCLEDVCGDPNVLLKPIEHIVWVVRERVRSVLCGLGKPAQVKKKKKKKNLSPDNP